VAKRANTSKIGVALNAPSKVADVLVFAQNVHDKMAASAVLLPTPSPALTVLQTDIATLASKETLVKGKAPGAVIDRNAALNAVKVDLSNDTSSSWRTRTPRTPRRSPTRPACHVRAEHAHQGPAGREGGDDVRSGAARGPRRPRREGEWQYSSDAGKTWVDLPTATKASTTVSNLPPGTTVQFRQWAVTKNGVSDWSLPAPHVVS
jgi:hypothetical protein